MNLIVLENDGVYTVDSREVAKMVNKEHKNLLRDIRTYCDSIAELKFEPCYLCTKNGDFNYYKSKIICYTWYIWEKGFSGNTNT